MGNLLKLVAAVEMLAAIIWAVVLYDNRSRGGMCGGISDILTRLRCEDLASAGHQAVSIYILVAGAVGALIFYSLGHIVTLTEEMHKRVCIDKEN